jgi:hypothetical protein
MLGKIAARSDHHVETTPVFFQHGGDFLHGIRAVGICNRDGVEGRRQDAALERTA